MDHKDYFKKINGPFGSYVIRKAVYYGENYFYINEKKRCLLLWLYVNTHGLQWEWKFISHKEGTREEWQNSPQRKAYYAISSYANYGERIGVNCKVILSLCSHCYSTEIIEVLPKEDQSSKEINKPSEDSSNKIFTRWTINKTNI